MAIEAAVYINTLVPANPPSTDGVAEGDDHLRLLKTVLQATFPNISGAVTPTHTILNGLDARVTAEEASTAARGVSGNTITTVSSQLEVISKFRADVGAAYAIVIADRGRLITRTNAAMADTIPIASTFGADWFCEYENINATVSAVITPTTSTINGAATLAVHPGQRVRINSDGTNYRATVMGVSTSKYAAKSAGYTLLPGDVARPTILEFTTAGVSLITTVAASNFTGGMFWVKNSAASGTVTFDPLTTETVDGALTLLIFPGETYGLVSDGTNWKIVAQDVNTPVPALASKTASYTATTADRGKSIRFAGLSADATLTLPSAASCGDGFILFFTNEDTNDTVGYGVIVDPNGAELIDGLATRKAYTGSRIGIICDGTGWRTLFGNWRYFSGDQTITASTGINLTHSLGVRPTRVWGELKCTTADAGYSVGDTIGTVVPVETDGATSYGVNLSADTTTLRIMYAQFGNVFHFNNKTTFAFVSITTASWRFRAYAEV